uniref:ADP-ribosylation factor-like protein 13B n=1 Tax=Steinernema glaseri TaxID=37863 RepID=A0A1I7XWE7_9BILA
MGCMCSRGFGDDEAPRSSCCCCVAKRAKKRRIRDPITVCVIGLDGAGKTTIMKALRNESPEWVQQTHGFCREEFTVDRQKIVAYDLGGDRRIREIWPTYFSECYAVVFVIDGVDASRMEEVNEEVMRLKGRTELHGKPLLVFLNKKDSEGCLGEVDLAQVINFQEVSWDLNSVVRVEAVSALSGYGKTIDRGIIDGFRYVLDLVDENYDSIDDGVRKATKLLEERRRHEKAERQMRLAEMEAQKSESDIDDSFHSDTVANGSISHGEEPLANGGAPRKMTVSRNQVEPLESDAQSSGETNYEIFTVKAEMHQASPPPEGSLLSSSRRISVKTMISPQPEVFAGDYPTQNTGIHRSNAQIAPPITEWPLQKRKHRRIAQVLNSEAVAYRRNHSEECSPQS